MGTIPFSPSQVSARSAGEIQSRAADTSAIGGALKELGGVVRAGGEVVGDIFKEEQDRQRRENTANRTAQAAPEMARIALQSQQDAPEDGSGTVERTAKAQDDYIENMASQIKDDTERRAFRVQMYENKSRYGVNATEFEYTRKAENSKLQADASLSGLENVVRADASQYGDAIKNGDQVIDARPGLNAAAKAAMKQEWRNRSAAARFGGLMGAARETGDFDTIAKQLTEPGKDGPDWRKELTPQAFDQLLDQIVTAKKAFATQADVQARAAVETLEARNTDLVHIDPTELSAAQKLADQSQNPVTAARMARIQRDQQIITREGKLTPDQLDQRANTATQGGNYPQLPSELNSAIGKASQLFPGVSAGYLGNTIMREYGGYIRAGRAATDGNFRPRITHNDVDLNGIRPDVLDAVTNAGKIFGAPLPITSGFRSQAKQDSLRRRDPHGAAAGLLAKDSQHTHGNAVDISTDGMDESTKAKLVDSLLQAGFTAFGEYTHHIHADVRGNAPRNYNAGSRNLGWTRGSAEVIAALEKRGYGPGVGSGQINRAGDGSQPAPARSNIDYGVTATGSSATGVMQFTDKTWLDLLKDGATAQRIGVDVAGKSDAELLALRKDPGVSVLMGAALADKNRKAVEAGIGRTLTDAELYMAHFLGSQGATVLLQSYASNGSASAASLLPEAARSNESVFFKKNGEAYSVKEVYDRITSAFVASPTNVQYGDSQTYKRMADNSRKQIADDPMTYAQSNSFVAQTDLNSDTGFSDRAAGAKTVADYYKIPIQDMKPFTASEATDMIKRLKEGNANETLALMGQIAEMDRVAPGMAKAAYAQLGEKDTTLGYAASLAADRGEPATAAQIVRGQKMLSDDKTLESSFGEQGAAQSAFNNVTGTSLFQLPAADRNAIFNAAKAHYAATYVANKGAGNFSQDDFETSVKAVLGGDRSIGEVNGKTTLLPKGVTEETFDTALNNMNDSDLVRFSENGKPPVDAFGSPVSAADIGMEGEFVAIGGDQYKVRMGDGLFLSTGQPAPGAPYSLQAYVFLGNADNLEELAFREGTADDPTPGAAVPVEAPVAPAAPDKPTNAVRLDGLPSVSTDDPFGNLAQ